MAQVLIEKDWIKDTKIAIAEIQNLLNPTKTSVIEYPIKNDILIQKQLELVWKQARLEEQLENVGKEDDEDQTTMSTTHDEDNALIWDAYSLIIKIDDEWNDIVTAIPNRMDDDEYYDLIAKQKVYFAETVYDRGFDVYDVIKAIIETGFQKESMFGDYKNIYKSLNDTKGKEACKHLRSLSRRLKRCLPKEVEMKESLIRTPETSPHFVEGTK